MSLRRIAARSALAAAGVLASAALMAAPTWAETNNKGGNSNQAMACHGTAWESLINPETGKVFTSHDLCVSVYADKLT
jgi:hypothetical protein